MPDTFKSLVRMLCRVGFSCEPESLSMLWFLFYLKANGGLVRFQSLRWPVQGAQGYRLKKGAQSIALELTNRLNAGAAGTVVLGAPVAAIADRGDHVEVEAAGKTYTARQALIALSPVLWPTINFVTPLPPSRAAAAMLMKNASMIMTFVVFDTPFWRVDTTRYGAGTVNGIPVDDIAKYGLSGDVLLADSPVVWIMDNTSDEGQAALMAFIVGDAADEYRAKTKDDRQALVLKTMGEFFGDDNVAGNSPVYYELDWNTQTLAKGCPAGHFPPGTFLTGAPGVLLHAPGAEPSGNLHFASTESALIGNGYMSGAVWSGEQVALDIRRALGDSGLPAVGDPFLREIAMRDAVNCVMQALAQQNPTLEWPALAEDFVFTGPGGRALPADPYSGHDGTVGFYARMGFFISLSKVNVTSVSVDVPGNTAYAEFEVEGIVNATQQPFHGVRCRMVFVFTDPAQPAALIQRDWLLMDVAEIDRLIFGEGLFDPPAAEAWKSKAEGLVKLTLDAIAHGNPVTDPRCALTVIEGPGGAYFPRGPYLGQAGFAQVSKLLQNVGITKWDLQSMTTDLAARQTLMLFTITGTGKSSMKPFSQPCLVSFCFANNDLPMLRSMSYVTNSLAFD